MSKCTVFNCGNKAMCVGETLCIRHWEEMDQLRMSTVDPTVKHPALQMDKKRIDNAVDACMKDYLGGVDPDSHGASGIPLVDLRKGARETHTPIQASQVGYGVVVDSGRVCKADTSDNPLVSVLSSLKPGKAPGKPQDRRTTEDGGSVSISRKSNNAQRSVETPTKGWVQL